MTFCGHDISHLAMLHPLSISIHDKRGFSHPSRISAGTFTRDVFSSSAACNICARAAPLDEEAER